MRIRHNLCSACRILRFHGYLEEHDGGAWTELDRWTPENGDDDDTWHLEEYPLSSYSGTTDFKVRFAAFMDTHAEDVAIDDVKIFVRPP